LDTYLKEINPNAIKIGFDNDSCFQLSRQVDRFKSEILSYSRLAYLYALLDAPSRRLLFHCKLFPYFDIFIHGERGTGKTTLARYIHELTNAGSKFVTVSGAELKNPELLHSLLFGHVKGSFTGACSNRKGYVEEAMNGTLFIDDIHTLPPASQQCLLTFLQERQYRRLGESSMQNACLRVITATNVPESYFHKVFEPDFLDRIRHTIFRINPLRSCRNIILPMAKDVLQDMSTRTGINYKLSPGACQKLLAHDWPGNIRELKAVVESSCFVAGLNSVVDSSFLRL
ncbi:MAG: sigma-54-dependent Fis family transcriptional regulator, partial [Gammaproteobacteria bacterium]